MRTSACAPASSPPKLWTGSRGARPALVSQLELTPANAAQRGSRAQRLPPGAHLGLCVSLGRSRQDRRSYPLLRTCPSAPNQRLRWCTLTGCAGRRAEARGERESHLAVVREKQRLGYKLSLAEENFIRMPSLRLVRAVRCGAHGVACAHRVLAG